LVRCAEAPDALLDLIGPSSDRSTLRALADFYGRRPLRIVETLRSTRPLPRTVAQDEISLVGQRGPSLEYQRLDRSTWSALRAWRDDRCPDVSVAAVLFSLTSRAFASSGLRVDAGGFYLLVDNRRFLRGPVPLTGNLAKSVYVRPDDPTDPFAVHHTIRETVSSGRTLASSALSAFSSERQRRRLERTGAIGGWAPSSDAVLSLTYLRRLRALESLPWLGDGERWLVGCNTTGSSAGITVYYAEVDGELHISVSYIGDRIDEAGVRRAVDLLRAGTLLTAA
jgi:hypothetical protein